MLNKRNNVEWLVSEGLTPYLESIALMDDHVALLKKSQNAHEKIWLLEHPPLYTAGISARPDEVLDINRFAIYKTRRGGGMTYHGPGQRIAYVMLDLGRRGRDVRRFVFDLEKWIILTLAAFGIKGEKQEGQIGIWVGDDKIAAIGIRLSHWISSHGISINLAPDLEHFSGIIPCGIKQGGITSLHALGCPISMSALDKELKLSFQQVFQTP